MFAKELRENWLKILKYNNQIKYLKTPEINKEQVYIPFTPIKIDAFILHSLIKYFYPKYISDKQNILDVVLSKDNNKINGLYLYNTNEAGIQDSFKTLKLNFKTLNLTKIESKADLANQILKYFINEKKLTIGSIRVINEEAIDLVNEYHKNLHESSMEDFFVSFLDLIKIIFDKDLIYIFPVPNIFKFLKRIISFLYPITLANLYKFCASFTPEMNSLLILNDSESNYGISIKNKKASKYSNRFKFNFFIPDNSILVPKQQKMKNHLASLSQKYNSHLTYYFELKHITSMLSSLIEMNIPFEKEQIKLFLQKLLFGMRKFDDYWYFYPIPRINWTLFRFLIRLFLFLNFNLRKLSHWSIPDLLFDTIEPYLGLNSKNLLIITDHYAHPNIRMKEETYIRTTFKSAFLIEIENRKLIKISPFNKENIFSEADSNSIEKIHARISENLYYISSIINLDISLINVIITNYLIKFYNFNLFSKIKTIRKLKKIYYFNVFPKLPLFRIFKNKGSFSLFKILLKISIDKHEF